MTGGFQDLLLLMAFRLVCDRKEGCTMKEQVGKNVSESEKASEQRQV